MEKLYEKLAAEVVKNIGSGLYQTGERLPSVRVQSRQLAVSVSTVVAAYRLLEQWGYVAAHDRSGYVVSHRVNLAAVEPATSSPYAKPGPVTGQELVLRLVKAANNPDVIQFGAAVPDRSFLPVRAIQQAQIRVARNQSAESIDYAFPPGLPALRRQIARHMSEFGCATGPDEIIITNGCQEALTLALKAVTKPGDIVAIESPTFYGLLQVLESLGLEALEMPTNPRTGISVAALDLALTRWDVKACVIVPNFSNPLGFCMPDENKKALIKKLHQHNIPLIEDDVYGDLGFGPIRPSVCKGLVAEAALSQFELDQGDEKIAGLELAKRAEPEIFYCGSFSKTLSPGLRVGWIVPPRKYHEQIEYKKYVLNLATPTSSQMVVAEMLTNGVYQRQLRKVRQQYAIAVNRVSEAVIRFFPNGTKVTRPEGGCVIWLELPEHVNSVELANQAIKLGISISPGPIFSASGKYLNFIRISCACEWTPQVEDALARVARLIH
ncbi:MAG: PLP-dependent aminotransferase family protein [Pseudomonadales bacterium]|nr:PLP-dependent aminotransferase family protein [Pseudomonadales bacterium]